jgi:hypothetical protein
VSPHQQNAFHHHQHQITAHAVSLKQAAGGANEQIWKFISRDAKLMASHNQPNRQPQRQEAK